MGLGLLWAPLWPIYRQSLAAGDHIWVWRTFRRSILVAAIFSAIVAAILTIGFNDVAEIWVQRPLAVSAFMLLGFAFWCVLDAVGTAIAALLNAAGILRYQMLLASSFALISLALKAYLLNHFGLGVLPWVTALSYTMLVLLPLAASARAIRSRVQNTK